MWTKSHRKQAKVSLDLSDISVKILKDSKQVYDVINEVKIQQSRVSAFVLYFITLLDKNMKTYGVQSNFILHNQKFWNLSS